VDPQYLTWEDERNFGPEILDVAQRAARQAMAPVMNRLEQENEQLRDHVAQQVQQNLHQQVQAAIPNWQQVNSDPRWLAWLNSPEPYSGYLRQELLNDATAKGDAGRVISIFRGFLAAVGQPGQVGPSSSRTYMPAAGPGRIYTRDQITRMWDLRRQGKINDEQWRSWQIELVAAGREGRIRAALDWQTGLPVSL
jgi:hypothetical protein